MDAAERAGEGPSERERHALLNVARAVMASKGSGVEAVDVLVRNDDDLRLCNLRLCVLCVCVLCVACCVLRVVCCVLRLVCCVLRVVCCGLRGACCMLRVVCCVLRVVYGGSHHESCEKNNCVNVSRTFRTSFMEAKFPHPQSSYHP